VGRNLLQRKTDRFENMAVNVTFSLAVVALMSAMFCHSMQASAFLMQPQQSTPIIFRKYISGSRTTSSTVSLALSSSSNSRSRIEGNQREPTEQELQIMDEMIDKLSTAKAFELPNAVRRAFRVISSPQFFLRIAERSDKASDEMEKMKLETLASNLVATLEAVVETTEETLDERAKEVEQVLKAAAEPGTGEFLVPLLPEQVQGMRKVVEGLEPSSLDEGFLSTVDAFMMKSHQDGMVRPKPFDWIVYIRVVITSFSQPPTLVWSNRLRLFRMAW
jgi:hypothetical protein